MNIALTLKNEFSKGLLQICFVRAACTKMMSRTKVRPEATCKGCFRAHFLRTSAERGQLQRPRAYFCSRVLLKLSFRVTMRFHTPGFLESGVK